MRAAEMSSAIVRETEQFRTAEAAGKLIRLPTGDGMVLTFFTGPDAPVRCAVSLSRALKNHPEIKVRMGIQSGPVDLVHDVNDRPNVAGAGSNMAQRVMDCADGGHILLSKRSADDLAQYDEWKRQLHDLAKWRQNTASVSASLTSTTTKSATRPRRQNSPRPSRLDKLRSEPRHVGNVAELQLRLWRLQPSR
jgi:hypothetical protein